VLGCLPVNALSYSIHCFDRLPMENQELHGSTHCICYCHGGLTDVFYRSDNWVEVTWYERTHDSYITEPFICNFSEWRIRYESTVEETKFPMIIYGAYPLNIATYLKSKTSNFTDNISADPTNGIYFYQMIHNKTGAFYLNISTGYLTHYSVIVEQNTGSVLATQRPSRLQHQQRAQQKTTRL